jgi:hypothetical protein
MIEKRETLRREWGQERRRSVRGTVLARELPNEAEQVIALLHEEIEHARALRQWARQLRQERKRRRAWTHGGTLPADVGTDCISQAYVNMLSCGGESDPAEG